MPVPIMNAPQTGSQPHKTSQTSIQFEYQSEFLPNKTKGMPSNILYRVG
jgi:hypothetical protein